MPSTNNVYWLDCWRTYLLESDEPLTFPPGFATEIPPFDEPPYHYQVNFGDYVGRFNLAGSEFRVTSKKLDEAGFECLLQDISNRVAELPFDFNSPTFVPFDREATWAKDLIYHALLYLRWARWFARPTFPEIWAGIAADPHRSLVRDERRTAPWETRAVSTRTLERILVDSHLWIPLPERSPLASTWLARVLGHGGSPCFRVGLEGDLNILYKDDIRLSYNWTFSRNRAVSHSYSLPLRPDISLRIGGRLHLFDAKFRIEKWEMPEAAESEAEDEAAQKPMESAGYFKAADIHKMHAYRDAISEGGSSPETVWVLYPGTSFAFYDRLQGFEDAPEALGKAPRGVGAIPLSPSDGVGKLERVIEVLVGLS